MIDPVEELLNIDRESLDSALPPGVIAQRAARHERNRVRRRIAAATAVVLVCAMGLVGTVLSASRGPVTEATERLDEPAETTLTTAPTPPSVDEFFRAVRGGETSVVEVYAQSGGDLDTTDANGFPAVMLATIREDQVMVELLLTNGADPDTENDLGETALHAATRWGQADLVKLLVGGGADVDHRVRARDDKTPLMVAANFGHLEAVEALLAGGADPNLVDEGGYPALAYAIYGEPTSVIPVLVDGGADLGLKVPDGSLADYARAEGVAEAVFLLEAEDN